MTDLEPHVYCSGVFHDTPPGEAIGCCDLLRNDPIHLPPPPPPRVCECSRLSFRHFWSKRKCPA